MIDLFEHDFVRWAEEQARAVREGRLDVRRDHLARRLAESPSLRAYLDEAFAQALPDAIRCTETETSIVEEGPEWRA